MSRKFRNWTPDQDHLFPPSPRDWLPEDHLVYFLLDVCEPIDIRPIVQDYDSDQGGKPPFHPCMMLVLLLYAYSAGVFPSRKIMARCETDVAFRVIVGDDIPDFRRIAEFRRRHLKHAQASDESQPQGTDGSQASYQERPARILATQGDCRTAMDKPPLGQIKHCRGFRQFMMRGLEQMKGEWRLVCLTHNLLKLFRHATPVLS